MRTVVSFTTIPSRIGDIKPMVESILSQTMKPDRFVLWLPDRCVKEGKGYEVPKWLEPMVEIVAVKTDHGPAMKLVQPLLSETAGTRIVTVDDDVVYESHALAELSEATGNAVFGFMGRNGSKFFHAESVSVNTKVSLMGGYRGVAYLPELFDGSLIEELETLLKDGMFVCDDHLFGWNLNRRGIPMFVVPTKHHDGKHYNFRFLRLGGGIHLDGDGKMAGDSLKRLKQMYVDRNYLRVPAAPVL